MYTIEWVGIIVFINEKKVSEKEKPQKPNFVDSWTWTDRRTHCPPQALTITRLGHRDIQRPQYVLLSLSFDQCYFRLASVNSGPCAVIELATQYLGTNNQTTPPRKTKLYV